MADGDFRIAFGWRRHPKRKMLLRLLGPAGVLAVEDLWAHAAENVPNGNLTGLSDDAIEVAADWQGERGALVSAMTARDVRLLDGRPGRYRLHDWSEHQPWIVTAPERKAKAAKAAKARWTQEKGGCSEHAWSIAQSGSEHARSNAPSLPTDPSLPADPSENREPPASPPPGGPPPAGVPYQELADAWNEIVAPKGKPSVRKVGNKLKPRIRPKWAAHPTLDYWRSVMERLVVAKACIEGPWCDFAWLWGANKNGAENDESVLAGKYDKSFDEKPKRGTDVVDMFAAGRLEYLMEHPSEADAEERKRWPQIPSCA